MSKHAHALKQKTNSHGFSTRMYQQADSVKAAFDGPLLPPLSLPSHSFLFFSTNYKYCVILPGNALGNTLGTLYKDMATTPNTPNSVHGHSTMSDALPYSQPLLSSTEITIHVKPTGCPCVQSLTILLFNDRTHPLIFSVH